MVVKPGAPFYAAALADLGTAADETAMIGDDVAGDEDRIDPAPTATVADLRAVVDWLLARA